MASKRSKDIEEKISKNINNTRLDAVIAIDEDFDERVKEIILFNNTLLSGGLNLLLNKGPFIETELSENSIFRVDVSFNYLQMTPANNPRFGYMQLVLAVESNDTPQELGQKFRQAIQKYYPEIILMKFECEDDKLLHGLSASLGFFNFYGADVALSNGNRSFEKTFIVSSEGYADYVISGPRISPKNQQVYLTIPAEKEEVEKLPSFVLDMIGKAVKADQELLEEKLTALNDFKTRFSKDIQLLWEV